MMINRILFSLVLFLVFTSCKQKPKVWSDLPDVSSLADFKQTAFVPTLENPIGDHQNVIYAPSLLYAWEKLEVKIGQKIIPAQSNSRDFKLMAQSRSFQNSLKDNEYSADVSVEGNEIRVVVFFNVTLPFETKLQQTDSIIFGKKAVTAFGMDSYDGDVASVCQILYYKNDNKFVLKLRPKNQEHEILLVKGLDKMPNLATAVRSINGLVQQGNKERLDAAQQWKYGFIEDDVFSIPAIQFNIETNYKQLEGQTFKVNGVPHFIKEASQRNGFILNENGAVVESEALMLDSAAAMMEEVVIPVKKMIFDKPFYIIVKKVDASNPYFVMKVDNTELMIEK